MHILMGSKLTHNVRQTDEPQHQCMAANFIAFPYLADHSGFDPQSGSLYALVGPFSSKANEKLVTMDGFPCFG